MRSARGLWLRVVLVAIAGALLWGWTSWNRHREMLASKAISDLSTTSPLNQQGGGLVAAEAYEIYSALYQAPMEEPLAFAEDSMTDIPQVDGSCLKPSTPEERAMADAFAAANRQSHRWEQRFAIPGGYRLLRKSEALQAQTCVESHGQDVARCGNYKLLRHVRYLGVPVFDSTHTRALVSVVKKCGGFCGSGGIFEVEKTDGAWRRAEATDFTRECSWMY
jgi:hypothetical protein